MKGTTSAHAAMLADKGFSIRLRFKTFEQIRNDAMSISPTFIPGGVYPRIDTSGHSVEGPPRIGDAKCGRDRGRSRER